MKKVLGMLALLTVAPLAGQERVERVALSDEVTDSVMAFMNDPATLRFNGRVRVPADAQIVGPVGVLGGPLVVAGRLEGTVVLINGDLRVEEGGVIDGNVTVIGGQVAFLPPGAVTGDLTVYEERLAYVARGGEVRLRGGPRTDRRGIYVGDSRITFRAGTNYNRVEGLPILFGPVLRASGSNPLQLEGLAIWRTEQGATRDNVGYRIRLEQQFGVPARMTVGASAFSEVDPIEGQGMRDLEASLTTFVLHRDYRDYFERQGFSLFAGAPLGTSGLDVRLEYRNEDHMNLPLADPWTLRRRDAPWRPLPLIAAGELESLTLGVTFDGRNDRRDPTDGWLVEGRVTRGLGGSLARPAFMAPETRLEVPEEPVSVRFTSGLLDVRRYARVGPDADLTFRGLFGGALWGGGLPSQYQHALGGEGSVPGYRPFSLDCGARDRRFLVDRGGDQEVFLRYGCDRFALFQVEYRGHFSIDLGIDPVDEETWERWDWYPAVDLSPSWAVFFDAGRGWSRTEGFGDTETAADLGVGLFLGQLGLYWAYPLTGDDRKINFFVRLQRRF
jgi:hypothetical protein